MSTEDASPQQLRVAAAFDILANLAGRSVLTGWWLETLSFPLLPLPLVLLLIVDSGSFVVPLLHPGPRPRTLCRWTSVV